MDENKGSTHAMWLAIFSAVISTFSVIFTGCQAYEAHGANEDARAAMEDTRLANERADQAQSRLAEPQERQFALQHQQDLREQRRMAELVFLDKSCSDAA